MRSKHFFLTLGMSLLLMSACSAQQTPEENASANNIQAPLLINKSPQPTSTEKTAPVSPTEVTGDNNPEVVARPPAQPHPPVTPPPPCAGLPAGVKVDPRVQEFLTCKVIQVLAKPDQVGSFRVKPIADTSVPEQNRLLDFPIEQQGQGPLLSEAQLKNFQSIVFSEKSYIFDAEKRCRFRPEIGLHFVKGTESIDVLLSFECSLWVFDDMKKMEDFDPVQAKLLELGNALFPVGNTPPAPPQPPQPPTQN